MSQEPINPSSSAAGEWFKDASLRNGPKSPSDFDLFEVPVYSIEKWAQTVSLEPWNVHCCVVKIDKLGGITKKLFCILKEMYSIKSSEAVPIFNKYLGAACPECFGGLTGEILQTVESYKNSAGTVILGGESGVQRILEGSCASCRSKKYYIVWHGDKKSLRSEKNIFNK